MKDEKLTVIGSKSYKEFQLVMLPTHKQTQIAKAHKGNRMIYADKPMSDTQNNRCGYMNQHLYILSLEEIKEGDWCLIDNNVGQSKGYQLLQCEKTDINNGWYYFKDFKTGRCKKIIATTDFELRTPDSGMKAGYYMKDSMPLPRPSDDFIKAYVKAQNKITKVLVEYEGFIGCSKCGREYPFPMAKECFQSKMCKRFNNLKLKVSPDNTITIRAVEEEKKDYGIEYLKFIATRFAHECRLKGVVSNHETCTLFDKWIKENL